MSEDRSNGNGEKPNLRVAEGGAPRDDRNQKVPPELENAMKVVASQCGQMLAAFYPEVYATDQKRLAEAASRAGSDIAALQPLMRVLSDPDERKKHRFIRVGISKPSVLAGVPDKPPVWIEGPSDLSDVGGTDDLFSTATVLGLVFGDGVRALLYMQGYVLSFGTSDKRVVVKQVK